MTDALLEPGSIPERERVSRWVARAWWRTGQIAGRSARSYADHAPSDLALPDISAMGGYARQAFFTECAARRIPLRDALDALGDARWASFRDGYLYGWEMP